MIWSPLFYLNFKSFSDPNPSSFIRFQCILHDSGVIFSEFGDFYNLKRGDLIYYGNQFYRKNGWIIWSPLLYFNFKNFNDPNFSSFFRFQSILYDSGALLFEFWNFYKLKRVDLIYEGNQFCRTAELFGSSFYISILKMSRTQFLRDSLDFNGFCMTEEYFPQTFKIFTN